MPSTPQQVVTGAGCLDCQIPAGLQGLVLISLWAAEAGVPADAQTLVDGAKCVSCIPEGQQAAVLIYLLSQIAGQSDVQAIVNNSRCFDCISPGMQNAAMIYLLNQIVNP